MNSTIFKTNLHFSSNLPVFLLSIIFFDDVNLTLSQNKKIHLVYFLPKLFVVVKKYALEHFVWC